MRRLLLAAAACFTANCGSSSPTSPTSPAPTPLSTITIAGTLTATNGSQPLAGASIGSQTGAAVTNSAGGFTLTIGAATAVPLTISGPGLLTRNVYVGALSARNVAIDAIQQGGSFDLEFYRQMIRNSTEGPATSQVLRRWTRTPMIYLKTVDEVGEAIHGPTLDLIEATAKDAVPRWTSGAFGTPIVERGTGTREGVSGWITIKFPKDNTALAGYCGRAQVATDGGWLELGYHVPPTSAGNCRTANAVIAPHVVRHELGHALGFFHTATQGDLMFRSSWFSATGLPTARELYHAAIAYARPVGNTDPDNDPSSVVNLAPMIER